MDSVPIKAELFSIFPFRLFLIEQAFATIRYGTRFKINSGKMLIPRPLSTIDIIADVYKRQGLERQRCWWSGC